VFTILISSIWIMLLYDSEISNFRESAKSLPNLKVGMKGVQQ